MNKLPHIDTSVKGSSDPSYCIFEINDGKVWIRHNTVSSLFIFYVGSDSFRHWFQEFCLWSELPLKNITWTVSSRSAILVSITPDGQFQQKKNQKFN